MRRSIPSTLLEIPMHRATKEWVRMKGRAPSPESHTPLPLLVSTTHHCPPLSLFTLSHLQQALKIDINKLILKPIRKAKGTKTATILNRSPWTDG